MFYLTWNIGRYMFYFMMHSTNFIYGYVASDMLKDHSDSENGLFFSISSKESFMCTSLLIQYGGLTGTRSSIAP